MLAVDGQDFDALLLRTARHELARDDERLLVRKRDVLPGIERFHRRLETGKAHHRRHDDVNVVHGRRIDKRLPAARKLRPLAFAREVFFEPRIGRFIGQHGEFGAELFHLLREQLIAAIRGQHGNMEQLGMAAHDVERLRADGACRAQNG